MDTIRTGFIRPYGTTGPVFSSAASPGTIGTTQKRQMENAGIEPSTTTVGVLTTKPFPCAAVQKLLHLAMITPVAPPQAPQKVRVSIPSLSSGP